MQAYPGAVPQAAASASHYVTKVQLNICCKKLADKDLMSKSDPMAVVLVLKNNNWIEVRFLARACVLLTFARQVQNQILE